MLEIGFQNIFKFFEPGWSSRSRLTESNTALTGIPKLPGATDPSQAVPPFSGLIIGSRQVPLLLVRHRRARRYVLRLQSDGSARVTIPRQGTAAGARAFAERNRKWLERQLTRLASCPPASPGWRVGGPIWFRGERVILQQLGTGIVRFGTESLAVPDPGGDLRPLVERHLRGLAAEELPKYVKHHAAVHGLSVRRVTVRDQKSRWGSCSSTGTISLNWRLIQTPAFVRDYIILHELAHLRHMNHSDKFWREVASLCPDYRGAKSWLKQHQQLLR